MTDLSDTAKLLLKAYVHAMALDFSVEGCEGVYPEVMRVMSSMDEGAVAKSDAAFLELEAAGLIGGHTQPSDLKAIRIRPDGIRRAVSEGYVEQRLAWTLRPHGDRAYEDVLAEMGDHGLDEEAAKRWRDEVEGMRDDADDGMWAHCGRRFDIHHKPKVLPAMIDAICLGLSVGPAVYAPVIAGLLGLEGYDGIILMDHIEEMDLHGFFDIGRNVSFNSHSRKSGSDTEGYPFLSGSLKIFPVRMTEHAIEHVLSSGAFPRHLGRILSHGLDGHVKSPEVKALRRTAADRYDESDIYIATIRHEHLLPTAKA